MNTFDRKTYGRIFVAKPEDVATVDAIVKELDEFEYGYMPDNFITVWPGKVEVSYGHKFEADIDKLMETCLNRGIWIYCVTGRRDPLAAYM